MEYKQKYEKKTISTIIDEIDSKKIYLPAIQRKYVWGEKQITRLMDSIMKGYPFGTFLFWRVKRKTVNIKGYSMYEFIKDYHERDKFKNDLAGQPFSINEMNEDETILAVLDGQQRLTSLYMALKGSISMKLPKKRWTNDDAFPKKELYFNLLSKNTSGEDEEIEYSFAFMSSDDVPEDSDDCVWYKVKDIVQYPDITSLNMYVRDCTWGTNKIAAYNINKLFERIKLDEIINYFEYPSDSIDDVLDIFVRVNSGGTVLSKTDLLFSTIISFWDDGREEIDGLLATINKIGDHYSFTNDFIMTTCLYVMDLPTTLKVGSFGRESVRKIKDNWNEIKISIIDTINFMNDLGFNSENIVAANAIVPLIYYRFKNGKNAFKDVRDPNTGAVVLNEKMEIRKYMVIAQIRHIFGQSTGTTLSKIRDELKEHDDKFRLEYLWDLTFAGGSSLRYDDSVIENWFDEYEKNAYTFMLLSLLYPNLKYSQKGFHQDHMHPYSGFEKDEDLRGLKLPNGVMDDERIADWRHKRNTLANLQLLEGRENESKNAVPLSEWLGSPENKSNVKYLPTGISYELCNFEEFLSERKKLMLDELKRILL